MRLLYTEKKIKPTSINDVLLSFEDLEVNKLLEIINIFPGVTITKEELASTMTNDTKLIKHRQQLVKCLFTNKSLYENLIEIFPNLYQLKELYNQRFSMNNFYIKEIMSGTNELVDSFKMMNKLNDILQKNKEYIINKELLKLVNMVENICHDEEFKMTNKNVSKLKEVVINPNSGTIGINLDYLLYPEEAYALDIYNNYIYPFSIIANKKKQSGIGKFKVFMEKEKVYPRPHLNKTQTWLAVRAEEYITGLNALNHSFSIPKSKSVTTYILAKLSGIIEMLDDLKIILGFIGAFNHLEKLGLPLCLPDIREAHEKKYEIDNLYNFFLPYTLSETDIPNVIKNDIRFGNSGIAYILTGANKGGKTTLVQAMGLNSILCHLGMYVTGSKATISVNDYLLTHYQKEEQNMDREGRLAFESQNIKKILEKSTAFSLVLINEPFSSTSPSEGELLTLQILIGLKIIGCNSLIVSHFHGLLNKVDKLNEDIPNGGVVDYLTMGVKFVNNQYKRTYKLSKEKMKKSYAHDVVNEYCKIITN